MHSFTLLNTRPAHQATELNDLVVESGGKVISCPTIEVEWRAPLVTDVKKVGDFDKLIFTSANAIEGWVRWFNQQNNQSELSGLTCYAIGKATKIKGLELGLNIVTLSDTQFDSEHFLAHQTMHEVKGLAIGLVKGVGGRALIENTLTERGAVVSQLNVYQRKTVPFCKQAWQRFIASPNPILLITSIESWQNLLKGLSDELNDSVAVIDSVNQVSGFVVMSQRIADEVLKSGCSTAIKVVTTQSNQGIVKTIQQYV